jgi:hypothetical protein
MDLELACPRCRKTVMLALSPMSAGNTLECTTCGEVIRFDAAPDHVAAQKAIEELKKLATAAPLPAQRGARPWWKFWGA